MPSIARETISRYHYDALDRLFGSEPESQATVQRFYQKNRLVTQIQRQTRHTLLHAGEHLLAFQRKHNEGSYCELLATDPQNSVIAIPQSAFCYTPYGSRHPNANSLDLPGFTGQQPDPVTGHFLLGNGYRAFNPVLMRFNSPDTLSPFDEGGLNAYAYCQDDPVNHTDPNGRFPIGALGMVTVQLRKVLPSVAKGISLTDGDSLLNIVLQSLRRNIAAPAPITPTREFLQNAIEVLDKKSPFVQKLEAVNKNFASHGNSDLTQQQAMEYAALAERVSTGKMSNSGAHAYAAAMWAHKLRTGDDIKTPIVAIVFNAAGAMTSGVHDHALLKTGALLRRGS